MIEETATSQPRPRLIVLSSTYPRWPNDPEPAFVHELAKRLVDRFEVVAVVPHAPGTAADEMMDGVRVLRYRYGPAALETLVQDGGMMTHLRQSPWKWLLVPGFLILQWVSARRLLVPGTIVHAHWIVPQGLIARCLPCPYMVTSHGADMFMLRSPFAMAIKRSVLARARAFTVVSRALQQCARDSLNAGSAVVRSMGVDLKHRFTPDRSTARDRYEILFVGRLVEKKGIDTLLRAMPEVVRRHPRVKLTIVGHGPLRHVLGVTASDLGVESHVRFVGSVAQEALPALYRRAAVFAAPFILSRSGDQDGLGLTVVEALGCGCPVIVGAVPATDDIIAEARSVRPIAPGDAGALATALNEVLEDPTAAAVAAAIDRNALVARFDWESVADEYAEMLQKLVL